jgi:hypothetical protein
MRECEHVGEEADAGRNRRRAGAVEIDRDLDVGFLGGPFHGRLAHDDPHEFVRLLSGVSDLRHRAEAQTNATPST